MVRKVLTVLALSLGVLWGGVEQVQAQASSNPVPATWGKIKAMYGQPVEKGGPQGSTMTDDWLYATYREICYALSKDKYNMGQAYWGTSARTIKNDGTWYAGDWNYMGLGIGNGGQCKTFASTIVNRATGGRYTLPSGYDYAKGSIDNARPGDVIQRSTTWGTQHTAIVYQVLARDQYGHVTLMDVIDSNFIASNTIARHKLPMWGYELYQFNVW